VDCRLDWYQTPTQVIASIFAKKVEKDKSSITFEENAVRAACTTQRAHPRVRKSSTACVAAPPVGCPG